MFTLHRDVWFSVLKEFAKKDATLAEKKGECWTILQRNISVDQFNLIKAKPEYEDMALKSDCVWLRDRFKTILLFEQSGIPQVDRYLTKRALSTCRQKDDEDVHTYYKRLHDKNKTCVNLFVEENLKPENWDIKPAEVAVIFIEGLNKRLYCEFLASVSNHAINKTLAYPKTHTEAYDWCVTFKPVNTNGPTVNTTSVGYFFRTPVRAPLRGALVHDCTPVRTAVRSTQSWWGFFPYSSLEYIAYSTVEYGPEYANLVPYSTMEYIAYSSLQYIAYSTLYTLQYIAYSTLVQFSVFFFIIYNYFCL
jgi:hypothetical protein